MHFSNGGDFWIILWYNAFKQIFGGMSHAL